MPRKLGKDRRAEPGSPAEDAVRAAREAVPADLSADRLAALLAVSGALAASVDLSSVLQTAVEAAVEALDLETAAVYTAEDGWLLLGATTPPLPAGFPETLRRARREEHPHLGRCLASGEPLWLADARAAELSASERAVVEARGLRSLLFVPLRARGQTLGAFIVGSTGAPRALGADELVFARTLGEVVGLAVADARLLASVQGAHAELEAAYEATLEGWSRALEMRDPGTNGHTVRVADLAVRLARRLGVEGEALTQLRRGALLHDIGKMAVPDAILSKPGPLSAAEWAVMREHPGRARAMLAPIGFLAPALDVPLAHHERWDGAGYPRGLAGEAIPLAARIFAVVDVFDALTSDRPYRPAWSAEAALAHVRAEAGRQFDPRVVEAFLALVGSGGRTG